jgi:hypothetical protein
VICSTGTNILLSQSRLLTGELGLKGTVMNRFPTWNWLASGNSAQRAGRSLVARPCLPAVEQLDDRILPSATANPAAAVTAPGPASPHAVATFLKWQDDFIKIQDSIIAIEDSYHKENPGLQVSNNYFIKLDQDLIQLDTDLAGAPSAAGTNAIGGIDGTIISYKRHSSASAQAGGTAVQAALVQTQADLALLSGGGSTGGTTAAAATTGGPSVGAVINAYLKLDSQERKIKIDLASSSLTWVKIETQFAGSDLEKAAAALGADLATAATDAAPQTSRADNAFIKWESIFIKVQDEFIKLEGAYLDNNPKLSPTAANYFLKIDADYVAADLDMDGINDKVLGGKLPPLVLQALDAAMATDEAALNADINTISPPVTPAAATAAPTGNPDWALGRIKYKEALWALTLDFTFQKIKLTYLEGDPDRPLIDKLAADLTTLLDDSLGITPGSGGGGSGGAT